MRATIARTILLCGAWMASRAGAGEGGREADTQEWHPYLFSSDGAVLKPGTVAVESGAGYNGITGSGGGLQSDDAHRVQAWATAAVGVLPRVELQGTFLVGDDPVNGFGFSQARVDLRVQLLTPRPRFPVAISVGAGYQTDPLYQSAVTGVMCVTALLGRLNLTLNVRGAHYFHEGRDPIDVFVTAGALVRATSWLRVGLEYVGEELEGVVADDGDGFPGGRHYVGPTAVVYLHGTHLRLSATGGPVFELGQVAPLARAALAYTFY